MSGCIPDYLVKRLQRTQLAVAGFVLGKYASPLDVLTLGWLPIKECRGYHLSKLVYKVLYFSNWPAYLKLDESSRTLRSSSACHLVVPLVTGTFQAEAARVFNDLPEDIRNCSNYKEYCTNSLAYFKVLAMDRLSNMM